MAKKNRQPKNTKKQLPSSITGAGNTQPDNLTPPDVSCCIDLSKPLLITTAELISLLSLSKSSIERGVRAGIIPGRVMIGRQVRYHLPTVNEWLNLIIKKAS